MTNGGVAPELPFAVNDADVRISPKAVIAPLRATAVVKVLPRRLSAIVFAERFFLRVTLGRSGEIDRVPILRERRTLPVVLTREEVARIIAAAPGQKYRTALSVAYGAGLRASEVVALKISSGSGRSLM